MTVNVWQMYWIIEVETAGVVGDARCFRVKLGDEVIGRIESPIAGGLVTWLHIAHHHSGTSRNVMSAVGGVLDAQMKAALLMHERTTDASQPAMNVRAWIPVWGAATGDDGTVMPKPKDDYEPWFIGHTDEAMLTDSVLANAVPLALAAGYCQVYGEEAGSFHEYLGTQGYTVYTTAQAGTIFVANIPEAKE